MLDRKAGSFRGLGSKLMTLMPEEAIKIEKAPRFVPGSDEYDIY
jgi:hypothetical protein